MLYEVFVIKETTYRAVVEAPTEAIAVEMVTAKANGTPRLHEHGPEGKVGLMGLETTKRIASGYAVPLMRRPLEAASARCLQCGETFPCRGVLQGTHSFKKGG